MDRRRHGPCGGWTKTNGFALGAARAILDVAGAYDGLVLCHNLTRSSESRDGESFALALSWAAWRSLSLRLQTQEFVVIARDDTDRVYHS